MNKQRAEKVTNNKKIKDRNYSFYNKEFHKIISPGVDAHEGADIIKSLCLMIAAVASCEEKANKEELIEASFAQIRKEFDEIEKDFPDKYTGMEAEK